MYVICPERMKVFSAHGRVTEEFPELNILPSIMPVFNAG